MIYFSKAYKYTDSGYLEANSELNRKLKTKDWVEADTELGLRAFRLIQEIKKKPNQSTIGQITRKLSPKEMAEIKSRGDQEAEMLKTFKDRVKKYGLKMKPIETVMTLDQDRIIFYFTAPERIDFRRLVKDMAATFHKLIRLQQINQRTAAMIMGGVGPCGRVICCRSLTRICPQEIRSEMIGRQGLQGVDSSKLTGACGKLACCLKYEEGQYQELLKKMPHLGEKIKVKEEGFGKVIDINPLKGTIMVRLGKNKDKEVKI